MMNKKGLTISFVIEAESANYGEGVGNVTALKKLTRGTGDSYTYISRQALRYNIIQQMGEDRTPLQVDGSVIQFAIDASIDVYPEIDLFGYMKTSKSEGTKTRAAIVRLSNAIALESFQADIDFLTNKSLFDRYVKATKDSAEDEKKGGNIAQSEIHHTYYTYTITLDLDRVGIDENGNSEGNVIEISNEQKAERVQLLIRTLKYLYRDIKGRRENLSPLFAIGGVYDIKNPFFENRIKIKKNRLLTEPLNAVLALDNHIAQSTKCGLIQGIFDNDQQLINDLKAVSIGEFFDFIEQQINDYYKGE